MQVRTTDGAAVNLYANFALTRRRWGKFAAGKRAAFDWRAIAKQHCTHGDLSCLNDTQLRKRREGSFLAFCSSQLGCMKDIRGCAALAADAQERSGHGSERRPRVCLSENKSSRSQAAQTWHHRDSWPLLHPDGQALSHGCAGDDGGLCRWSEIRRRLVRADAACGGKGVDRIGAPPSG